MKPYLTLTLLALSVLNTRAAEPMKAEAPKAPEAKLLKKTEWIALKSLSEASSKATADLNEAVASVCKDHDIADPSRCRITPPDADHPNGTVALVVDPPKPAETPKAK